MADSLATWFKLKQAPTNDDRQLPNAATTLVSLKAEGTSKIYSMCRVNGTLVLKTFNCGSFAFEAAKTVDMSETGINRVDFSIQKIIYASERLIIVKQTLQCDTRALILYEIKLNKAFPMVTKLPLDLLHNAIDARQDGMYIFGGHNSSLVPHSRVATYSFLTLKFEMLQVKEGPEPAPRFGALAKLVRETLVVAGGYSSHAQLYREQPHSDLWVLDLRALTWTQALKPESVQSGLTLMTCRGDDVVLLKSGKRTVLTSINSSSRAVSETETSNGIEADHGVV